MLDDLIKAVDVSLGHVAAVVVGGAGAAWLALARVRRIASNDSMETTASHASGDVIKLLATEIDRLSAQNTKLAEIVNKLQLEIIQLRTENADLAGYMRRHGYGQQDNKAADKSG